MIDGSKIRTSNGVPANLKNQEANKAAMAKNMEFRKPWSEFESWLAANCPELEGVLNAGATAEQLQAAESELGFKLPDDFKAFYSIHDGQVEDSAGLFDGFELLSLSGILLEHKRLTDFLANQGKERLDAGVTADTGVFPVYWKTSWIPFIRNDCGNYYCVDLGPTSEGVSGQIVGMWLMPPARSLLGRSIGDWFQRYVVRVLDGAYEFSEDEDGLIEIED
ncbi:SMI1/KNR4 family protein [Haloferula sp.]|uniref:SMI1/KNR4 family protein n=1 Tax=Haloferula sp. TaxID=2497595 RepID=UPI00329B8678